MYILIALFALDRIVLALYQQVVWSVAAHDPDTTRTRAGIHLIVAISHMLECFLVGAFMATLFFAAFKLNVIEVNLNVAVDGFEFDFILTIFSMAFLGAEDVGAAPFISAFTAE